MDKPANFDRDCAFFKNNDSFKYIIHEMKQEALSAFSFAGHKDVDTMQKANVKHRTVSEIEQAVINAAARWEKR